MDTGLMAWARDAPLKVKLINKLFTMPAYGITEKIKFFLYRFISFDVVYQAFGTTGSSSVVEHWAHNCKNLGSNPEHGGLPKCTCASHFIILA